MLLLSEAKNTLSYIEQKSCCVCIATQVVSLTQYPVPCFLFPVMPTNDRVAVSDTVRAATITALQGFYTMQHYNYDYNSMDLFPL